MSLMPRSPVRLAMGVIVVLGLAAAAAAQDGPGRYVRGVVSGESSGVLPGVTVVAKSQDGRVLLTAVTDGAGAYGVGPLPAGRVTLTLTFQLEGFAEAVVPVTVAADADAVVNQHLVVAPRSEM